MLIKKKNFNYMNYSLLTINYSLIRKHGCKICSFSGTRGASGRDKNNEVEREVVLAGGAVGEENGRAIGRLDCVT